MKSNFLDIDECSESRHNCDVNAACTDTKISFNCTCHAGFTGNGTYCQGKFEELLKNAIKFFKIFLINFTSKPGLTNSAGLDPTLSICLLLDITCFHAQVVGLTCGYFLDIDECMDHMDDCHQNASCRNNNGSFSCSCNSGFTGNGTDCEGMFKVVKGNYLLMCIFATNRAHETQKWSSG